MAATITYFPFDDGIGADSDENRWGDMMLNMLSVGIIMQGSEMGAAANSAIAPQLNMQIQAYAGKAWIRGFMFKHTGDSYPIVISDNDDMSGDDRIDLVTIRLDTVANTVEYHVEEGTVDPSPVPPSPVQDDVTWDLPLAQVYVTNGATVINSADITDVRVSANHATFRPVCVVSRTTDQTVTDTSDDPIEWDEVILDPMDMNWDSMNPERVYIREAGVYEIKGNASWERDDAAADTVAITIYRTSGVTTTALANVTIEPWGTTGHTLSPTLFCSALQAMDVDDYVFLSARNESGVSLDILSSDFYSPRFSVIKVGEAVGVDYF